MAVAAIAFLAILVVSASAESCIERTKGILIGIKHDTQVRNLPGGQNVYDIELDTPCLLLANGIRVTVCDPDAPPDPEVEILSLHRVRVTRRGMPWHSATLRATIYCLVGSAGGASGASGTRDPSWV